MKRIAIVGIVALALAGCGILPIQVGKPATTEDTIIQEYECPTAEFKVTDFFGNVVE
jgi:hypothetical protein